MELSNTVKTALLEFKASKPWTGTQEERGNKFQLLHDVLCKSYNIDCSLDLSRVEDGVYSGRSFISFGDHTTIHIIGKLSVVTYLHEFAHAIYRAEHPVTEVGELGELEYRANHAAASQVFATNWSLALFEEYFPKNFARLRGGEI